MFVVHMFPWMMTVFQGQTLANESESERIVLDIHCMFSKNYDIMDLGFNMKLLAFTRKTHKMADKGATWHTNKPSLKDKVHTVLPSQDYRSSKPRELHMSI